MVFFVSQKYCQNRLLDCRALDFLNVLDDKCIQPMIMSGDSIKSLLSFPPIANSLVFTHFLIDPKKQKLSVHQNILNGTAYEV